MKQIYTLAAWNLRKTIKPILIVWAIMAVAEFAIQTNKARFGPYTVAHSSYISSSAVVIFAIGYLSVLFICNFAALMANLGKTKCAYTLMTLPTPRIYLLISNITSSVIALAATISVQLILPILYYPILINTKLIDPRFLEREEFNFVLPNGAFLSFMRNDLSSLLFSTDFSSFMAIFATVICTTTLFCCIFFFKGYKRVLVIVACAFSGVLSFMFLAFTNFTRLGAVIVGNPGSTNKIVQTVVLSGILFAVAIFTLWRAAKSVQNAKNI